MTGNNVNEESGIRQAFSMTFMGLYQLSEFRAIIFC